MNQLKGNVVFWAAFFLACLSAVWVRPSADYVSYIDFRVLSLLFCLMVVIGGFRAAGAFEHIMQFLLQLLGDTRQMAGVLIFSAFFLSMAVTNDVSLIVLVPFSLLVFQRTGHTELLIPVIVMQTVAANLGSMMTPVGNPQNLYLYLVSHMALGDFILLLLPYTGVSFILLLLSLFFIPRHTLRPMAWSEAGHIQAYPRWKILFLAALFVLCLLTVVRVIDYKITLIIVLLAVLAVERKLIGNVDYMLLLTFVAFFIFVGNMRHIPLIRNFLISHTAGNEFLVSLIASQFISNVPAAVLISGFTEEYAGVLIGTDIGGLGTIVASMASLISYNYYCAYGRPQHGLYLTWFTVVNLLFLLILLPCVWLMYGFV